MGETQALRQRLSARLMAFLIRRVTALYAFGMVELAGASREAATGLRDFGESLAKLAEQNRRTPR